MNSILITLQQLPAPAIEFISDTLSQLQRYSQLLQEVRQLRQQLLEVQHQQHHQQQQRRLSELLRVLQQLQQQQQQAASLDQNAEQPEPILIVLEDGYE